MEAWELAHKIRKEEGIDEVWNAGEFLILDEKGTPILETWYQLEKGSERITKVYTYVDGAWVREL